MLPSVWHSDLCSRSILSPSVTPDPVRELPLEAEGWEERRGVFGGVWEREREGESVCVCVSVYVCERERV